MYVDNYVEAFIYVENNEVSNECTVNQNNYSGKNENGKKSTRAMNVDRSIPDFLHRWKMMKHNSSNDTDSKSKKTSGDSEKNNTLF